MPTLWESQIASLSPAVWYKFDGTGLPTDSGSAATTATLVGTAATASQTGISGSSYFFGGATRYELTSFPANTLDNKIFTIESVFRFSEQTSNTFPTIFRATNGSSTVLMRSIGSGSSSGTGKMETYIATSAGNYILQYSAGRVDDNMWHHAAIIADGTNVRLMLDGIQEWSVALPAGSIVLDNAGYRAIGRGDPTGEFMIGNIDELVIHTGALTNAQIFDNLKTVFPTRAEIAKIGSYSTKSVLYFPFDETVSDQYIYGIGSDAASNRRYTLSTTAPRSSGGVHNNYLNISSYTGYNSAIFWSPQSAQTLSFWIKKTTAPISNQEWLYWYYDSNNNIGSQRAKITTDGKLNFNPYYGANGTNLVTPNSICNNQWNHIAITRNGGTLKLYVNGSLVQTATDHGTATGVSAGNFQIGASNTGFDEFLSYSATLSDAQVLTLYQAGAPSVAVSYTSAVMTVSDANLPMPTVSTTRNIDINGGGVSTASALSVDPSVSAIRNVDYSHTASTASATNTDVTVTTTKTVEYTASPATASALISSNFYGGNTAQDSTYNLTIRKLETETGSNADANGGFSIGRYKTGSSGTFNSRQLLIIPTSGMPVINKIVKVKFDSAHVSASSTNDISPNNRFNVYKVTNSIASPTTILAAEIDKTLLYTTRLLDDSTSGTSNFYLDLTPAFADATAYTNGIVIESFEDGQSYSGWDETVFSGSNLHNHLLYILSADIISKNVNVDAKTATALMADPVITVTRTVNYSAAPATVSATIVTPEFGVTEDVTISATVVTASALAVQPTFLRTVAYPAVYAEAFGTTVNPTWYAQGTVTYNATVATASAELHMPQFNIGEANLVDHMNASATMPHGQVTLSRTVIAAPMTASATSVTASTASALNASITPEVMAADQAKIVTPPAYSLPTDDPWYNRLTLQHSYKHRERFKTTNLPGDSGTSSAAAFLKLWTQPATTTNTTSANVGTEVVTNLVSAESYYDGQVVSGNAPGLKPLGTSSTSVSPSRIQAGFYDTYGRKSVKIQNTELGLPEQNYVSDRGYSLEFSIKTTKQNQIIAKGVKTSYYYYGSSISGIGLKDGKLYGGTWDNQFTNPFPETTAKGVAGQTLYGSKNVADGEWHHIVIQFGYDDARVQYWVDGELDVQSIPGNFRGSLGPKVRPFIIGHGSSDLLYYSDFETSVWSYDAAFFLLQRELLLNYYSFIKYAPVLAEPMTASMDATPGATAKGNRTRALCLYWWPTNLEGANVGFGYTGVSWQFPLGGHTYDQGVAGEHDRDYGYPFTTWDLKEAGPQRWYDMDVFPVDISGYYVSEVVKPEAYGGAENIMVTGIPLIDTYPVGIPASRTYLTNKSGFFRKPKTDSKRYIDVLNDIDLSQFDVILFRNFPDDSREIDAYSKNEFSDSYFGTVEKELYEEFIVSLRKAVDTGISLHISNRQLAVDLGIVDRIEPVDNLIDVLGIGSDPHAPTIVPDDASVLVAQPGTYFRWADTFWNNKFRVRNTLEGLTDTPQQIITEVAFWQNDGLRDFSGSDRTFEKAVNRPNGLIVGDEMLAKDIGLNGMSKHPRFLGVPIANVKAGIPITTFGQKYWRGNEEVDNPYKDYATTIAVRPGDVLKGTQCGGKIFVNLAERPQESLDSYLQIDLKTDYWINKAYTEGLISLTKRDTLLADSYDRLLENGTYTQAQYDRNASWTRNDMALTGAVRQGNTGEQGFGDQFIGSSGSSKLAYNVSKKGQSQSLSAQLANLFSAGQQWFTVSFTYGTDYIIGYSPSMNTMSMNWLANRVAIEGNVNRPTAFESSATLVMPTVSAVKVNSIAVSAMIAGANSPDGQYQGPSRIIAAFPMEASVKFGNMVKLVKADPMLATTILPTNTQVITTSKDEVVLYVMHEDPVLYIREDLIK